MRESLLEFGGGHFAAFSFFARPGLGIFAFRFIAASFAADFDLPPLRAHWMQAQYFSIIFSG